MPPAIPREETEEERRELIRRLRKKKKKTEGAGLCLADRIMVQRKIEEQNRVVQEEDPNHNMSLGSLAFSELDAVDQRSRLDEVHEGQGQESHEVMLTTVAEEETGYVENEIVSTLTPVEEPEVKCTPGYGPVEPAYYDVTTGCTTQMIDGTVHHVSNRRIRSSSTMRQRCVDLRKTKSTVGVSIATGSEPNARIRMNEQTVYSGQGNNYQHKSYEEVYGLQPRHRPKTAVIPTRNDVMVRRIQSSKPNLSSRQHKNESVSAHDFTREIVIKDEGRVERSVGSRNMVVLNRNEKKNIVIDRSHYNDAKVSKVGDSIDDGLVRNFVAIKERKLSSANVVLIQKDERDDGKQNKDVIIVTKEEEIVVKDNNVTEEVVLLDESKSFDDSSKLNVILHEKSEHEIVLVKNEENVSKGEVTIVDKNDNDKMSNNVNIQIRNDVHDLVAGEDTEVAMTENIVAVTENVNKERDAETVVEQENHTNITLEIKDEENDIVVLNSEHRNENTEMKEEIEINGKIEETVITSNTDENTVQIRKEGENEQVGIHLETQDNVLGPQTEHTEIASKKEEVEVLGGASSAFDLEVKSNVEKIEVLSAEEASGRDTLEVTTTSANVKVEENKTFSIGSKSVEEHVEISADAEVNDNAEGSTSVEAMISDNCGVNITAENNVVVKTADNDHVTIDVKGEEVVNFESDNTTEAKGDVDRDVDLNIEIGNTNENNVGETELDVAVDISSDIKELNSAAEHSAAEDEEDPKEEEQEDSENNKDNNFDEDEQSGAVEETATPATPTADEPTGEVSAEEDPEQGVPEKNDSSDPSNAPKKASTPTPNRPSTQQTGRLEAPHKPNRHSSLDTNAMEKMIADMEKKVDENLSSILNPGAPQPKPAWQRDEEREKNKEAMRKLLNDEFFADDDEDLLMGFIK